MNSKSEGLNRQTLGKTYDFDAVEVDEASIRAYVGATGDRNPRYGESVTAGDLVAPPMYAVRLCRDPLFKPILDPEVGADILRLLHGEQDMTFNGLLRPGDRVSARSEVAGIVDKESGQILTVRMSLLRGGESVVDAEAHLFIRSRTAPARRGPKPAREVPPEPAWTFQVPVTVDADQSIRYARASLDVNPIHLDEATARAAGLKGIVLQGLCTMAFAQQAVISEVGGGDPRSLARLRVRFSKPVFPGDRLVVQGVRASGEEDGHHVDLRVINQDGVEVLTAGKAWLRG